MHEMIFYSNLNIEYTTKNNNCVTNHSNGHTMRDREKMKQLYTKSKFGNAHDHYFISNECVIIIIVHCIVRCGYDDEIFVQRIKKILFFRSSYSFIRSPLRSRFVCCMNCL